MGMGIVSEGMGIVSKGMGFGAIGRSTEPISIRKQNRAHFPRAPGLATRHTPGP